MARNVLGLHAQRQQSAAAGRANFTGGSMELDTFDRRLLEAVQDDSRRTGEDLAELVGLSPAACLRRLQRLRASGIIEREIPIVDPSVARARLT